MVVMVVLMVVMVVVMVVVILAAGNLVGSLFRVCNLHNCSRAVRRVLCSCNQTLTSSHSCCHGILLHRRMSPVLWTSDGFLEVVAATTQYWCQQAVERFQFAVWPTEEELVAKVVEAVVKVHRAAAAWVERSVMKTLQRAADTSQHSCVRAVQCR